MNGSTRWPSERNRRKCGLIFTFCKWKGKVDSRKTSL